MKTVTIHISDPVYAQLEAQARQANQQPTEFISEVLVHSLQAGASSASPHSVLDIKSFPLGPPAQPWTTRAEMLEGFMDDRG